MELLEKLAVLVEQKGARFSGQVPLFVNPENLHKRFKRGVESNLIEFNNQQQVASLVVPVKRTISGFVNVQTFAPDVPYDTPPKMTSDNFFLKQTRLLQVSGLGDFAYGHTIGSARNFGLHNGGINFRDFGDQQLVIGLIENRERVRQALDNTLLSLNKGKDPSSQPTQYSNPLSKARKGLFRNILRLF